MTWVVLLALLAQGSAAELRDRGVQLIPTKPAEAVKVLQQALRLDANLRGLRLDLGLAYHAIGDEADAEFEFREAISRTPDSAAAHNYLGIVLFRLGRNQTALEEFRTAARLAPNDTDVQANLNDLLARMAPVESTIKVDVRQVLVPVVVTDSDGHHVTGLTRGDFKVFEDDVEQKITAFNVESSGSAPKAVTNSPNGVPTAPTVPIPHSAVRRTYMIVIDTVHDTFNDFVSAREALTKLFEKERSTDSQYVVVALGASAEMILNVTTDASAVLAALQNKRMQKFFQDGQLGGFSADLERYRRDLNETRTACDAATEPLLAAKCQAGIDRGFSQAQALAEVDRTLTIEYLRQFRALVAQLAPAHDRRTIILLSDGFEITPGLEAYAMLDAFFPVSQHCLVPQTITCLDNGRQMGERLAGEFELILDLAAKSNITIDTIDSRGLAGLGAFSASNPGSVRTVASAVDRADRNIAAARGNTMSEIADATGGKAFHDNNNMLGGLQTAFADGRDYYTLAYVSSNANLDGKYRRITVQVSGRKVAVNAKRGYWATP
jgi:VWFA-related protein